MWHILAEIGKPIIGHSQEPFVGSFPISDELMDYINLHGTWLWDGVTVIEPVVTTPQPYVPTEEERVSALWQAAHDYEYNEISGSAVGMLAIGVMQGLPKCLAVQAWIKSIWSLYYTRKFGTSSDCDYSSCGAVPYSVPELMEELGL